MSTSKQVLVVGAGIAGLATALRLRRSGWTVQVVERAPGLRGGAYMINFSGIGYDAAETLGLLPALQRVQPDPVELVHVDDHGRRLAAMSVETVEKLLGRRQLTLLRGDLEQVLYDALDDAVEVRFGTTVQRIDQDDDGVTVEFSDGTRQRVDLLVGADGLHSRVRTLMFGPEEAFRKDFGCAVATYLFDGTPQGMPPRTTISLSQVGRGAGVYSIRGGRSTAFFSFSSNNLDADLTAGPQVTLRRRFGDLDWIMPEVLTRLDDAESVYFDRISQIHLDQWSHGRVVLLGDSAWCVSLFAGYGSSLAVAGAHLLGDALDQRPNDIPGALHVWGSQLRPTVRSKQRQGARAKSLFIAPNRFYLWLRLRVFRLSGTRMVVALMRRFLGLTGSREAAR